MGLGLWWVGRQLGNLTSSGASAWLVEYCHFPYGCNYTILTFDLCLVILYQHWKKFPLWTRPGLLTPWMRHFWMHKSSVGWQWAETRELISFRPNTEKWMNYLCLSFTSPLLGVGFFSLSQRSEVFISTCGYQLHKVKENQAMKKLNRNDKGHLLILTKTRGHQMTCSGQGDGPDDLPWSIITYILLQLLDTRDSFFCTTA